MSESEIIFYHPHTRIVANVSGNERVPIGNTATPSVNYEEDGSEGSYLKINVRPNDINWGFSLNEAHYPTYAGEVTQILSAYIDNMEISGDIRKYLDMELIYKWFVNYMMTATQGKPGAPTSSEQSSYVQDPVQFEYPHRGWQLKLRPLRAPNFEYGTDVVIPKWSIEAAVVEDENMKLTTFTEAAASKAVEEGLTHLNAEFNIQNPFNYYQGYNSQAELEQFVGSSTSPLITTEPGGDLESQFEDLSNFYNTQTNKYAEGYVKLEEQSTVYSKKAEASSRSAEQSIKSGLGGSSLLGNLPGGLEGSVKEAGTTSGSFAEVKANGEALAPKNAPDAVKKAISAGNAINTKPYIYGGGHGVNLKEIQPGYDCSSATSFLLYYAGILGGSEALDSEGLAKWGEEGSGEWITVYANPAAGEAGHAFIVVAGIAFDTVPYENHYAPPPPASGGKWYPAADTLWHIQHDDGTMIARHYPGL
jgi:hypothetical protein